MKFAGKTRWRRNRTKDMHEKIINTENIKFSKEQIGSVMIIHKQFH